MNRSHVALLACLLLAGGCAAEQRILRMQLDLAQQLARGRDDEALRLERQVHGLANEAFGPTDPRTFDVRNDVAGIYGCWRRTDHALTLATATRAEMEALYGTDDKRVGKALLVEAEANICGHRWKDAERVIDRVSRICREEYARESPYALCRFELGHQIDDYFRDVGAYRRSVDEYLRFDAYSILPDDHAGGVSMLTVIGRRLAEGGEYPEALWYLDRCVDESRARYDQPVPTGEKVWSNASGDVELFVVDDTHSFHSQSPRCLEDVIALRRKVGDDETADRLAAWQREMWSRGPDLESHLVERARFADMAWSDDVLTSTRMHTLAFYYAGKGRPLDAIAAYQDAIRLLDRGEGRDQRFGRCYSSLLVDELLGLGSAQEEAERFADAEAAYRRAVDVASADLNPQHAWRLETVARLARVLAKLRRVDESEAMWRRYLEIAGRMRGERHADFAYGLAGLSRTLADAGRSAEAATLRTQAGTIRAAYARRIREIGDLPLPAALRSPPSPAN